jgi:preprotein translocase subunit SecD
MRRSQVVSLVGIVVIAIGALVATITLGYAPKLGLDLQGGASVTLQPKGKPSGQALDQAVSIIRSRVDALGVAEPEITRQGDAIVVNLPGVKDQDRALSIVGKTAELRFRPVLQVLPPESATSGTPSSTAATTAPKTATTAPKTPTTAGGGGPGGAVPLPRQTSPTPAPATTAKPVATTAPSATTTAPASSTGLPTTPPEKDVANQTVVLPQKDSSGKVTERYQLGPAFLNGSAISDAQSQFGSSGWEVNLHLKGGANGIDTWNKVTEQCFNGASNCPGIGTNGHGQVAIVLDSVVQSAPVIQPDQSSFSPFAADQIAISGNFNQSEADNLALVLRYGALPVQLDPQAVQTVSATLGKDSLRAGVVAGIIGVSLVVLFMLIYYRGLAVVVIAGLAISAALIWTVISYLSETRGLALTLAGATGIIVSIGITVDSYVVYFERLKDDRRLGRSFRGSVQRGWHSAWRTILAADIVSLIGAVLLWYLTVGSVRGFAFFLGLSTLCDIVVAYFFLRPAVSLASRSRYLRGDHLLGVSSGEAIPAGTTVGASGEVTA